MTAARRQAVVAVLLRGDKILAIKRGPGGSRPYYWAPLSGTMEPGESEAETLVREVREEVGLEVEPLRRHWESVTDDGRYDLYWWTAAAPHGEVVPDPDEVADHRWITLDEFRDLEPIFQDDLEILERILSP